MKLTPVQNTFSAGELTPLWYGRSDTERYQQGLSYARNFICDARGPMFSRPGGELIHNRAGKLGRVFTFITGTGTPYGLFFTNGWMDVLDRGGYFKAANLIANPKFLDSGNGWTDYLTGVSVNSFEANIATGIPIPTGAVADPRAGYATSFTVTNAVSHDIIVVGDRVKTHIWIGTAPNSGDIGQFVTNKRVTKVSQTFGAPGTYYITIWGQYSELPDSHKFVRTQHVRVEDTSVGALVNFTPPYTERELDKIQIIRVPGGDIAYFVHPNHQVYKLTYVESTDTWTWAAVTFTAPPAAWTGTNWPATGTYYQGRLWLGGTPAEPETFWASKSALPEDFTQGTLAADGMTFTLEKAGRIRWMESTKNLLIGTANGEHIITSQGGVVIPGDIQVNQQSSYGSAAYMRPVKIGDLLLYTSPDRRRVYTMQYEWNADNWLSTDLSFPSEHLTKGDLINVSWAQNPYNLMWMVTRDGDMVSMTYERATNTIGWHRHNTNGKFLDVASDTGVDGNSFNITVTARQENELFVEWVEKDNFIMDSFIEVYSSTPFTTVTGLLDLEGLTVKVLVDGNSIHPDRTVASGQITLQESVNYVIIGLGYKCEAITMPVDKGSQIGSGRIHKKGWNKIWAQIYQSARPKINGKQPPVRSPSTPMGIPQPLETELVEVVNLGVDEDAVVYIEQELPLYTCITGLYGELNQDLPM